MPFITAPGMGINSSYSSAFVKAGGAGDGTLVAMARVNNKDHYWGLEQGTSMACPFVSGVVALWLEADPALTVDKIKDIMSSTAIKDNNVTEATVWGAGKVDAYNGIKEVLKQAVSGIADVAVDGDDLLISQVDGGRTVDVFSAGASKVEVQLYTVGGAMAASASADGDSVQLSAENLAPGVYIVRAGDGSRTATRKIVL
jgi:subtilisin family serine protease